MDVGRSETDEERVDRKFADLLQELRIMQTGAQLTAGFLLTLPFQDRFADLDRFQKGLYLALVLLAALTTAFVLAPVAVHRRLSGEHVKERVLQAAHRLVFCALTAIALMVAGMVTFIVDMVVDRTWAAAAGGGIAVVLVLLMVVLPLRLGSD
jgi:drug/metabolite transporter superfamily protein YnfA